jgi:hypothetical protein
MRPMGCGARATEFMGLRGRLPDTELGAAKGGTAENPISFQNFELGANGMAEKR